MYVHILMLFSLLIYELPGASHSMLLFCLFLATKPGICPNVDTIPTSDLICTSSCQSDDECTGSEKCCSNGCAYHCTAPMVLPHGM